MKVKHTISINEDVDSDTHYYAHQIGMNFSLFVQEALIEKIKEVKEELHESLYTEEVSTGTTSYDNIDQGKCT